MPQKPKIEHILMSGKEALQPENIFKLFEMITGRKPTPEDKAKVVSREAEDVLSRETGKK